MQLKLVAQLWGFDINAKGSNKQAYSLLTDDKTSIALIAAYIKQNEKELNIRLFGSDAGIAHNMGCQGYKMVLEGKKKIRSAKRSEEYQEAIKDALNGFIDTRKDRDR